MEVTYQSGDPQNAEAGLLILGVFADEKLPGNVANLLEEEDWNGKWKQTLLLYPQTNGGQLQVNPEGGNQTRTAPFAARRLLLLGLGERGELTTDRLRQVYATAAQKAREVKVADVAIAAPDTSLASADVLQTIAEGVLLALYRFDAFKGTASKKDDSSQGEVERVMIVGGEPNDEALRRAQAIYAGVKVARDLGNEPPMVCTPRRLAGVAEEIAQRGKMKLTVLDRPEMEELGMGGILGVARGTQEPPRFIVLEYGTKGQGKTLALVGKGITFDSGGISIKPGEKMDLMKMDMMGAAAVLGAMSVVADLQPSNVHVVGIVSASENLPSGSAFKPGDILRAMNGVTMEILNTDAEGRLVLADGLSYAQRYEPDGIVDLATLTGACVVALGNHISGLITNNGEFAGRVKAAADRTGELVWELPLLPEYREAVKSKIADIRNTAGRAAGTITAGAFLEHFVDGRPWVHLDIAGVAWAEDKPKPYAQEGATGFGVRLLVDLVEFYAAA
ncbi:MAG TPA: leucyl aminopeptidase [Herpetosiphonaceae bacterium]|nr:leucyl aminopeptidase [Herpetosiphonaceae bacterium]